MKFVKTAVAVAIAGIAAAPMIASAETTLSGIIEIKYAGSETDREDEQADASMQAGDVRVGVVSEHELNSGLIGYGSIKLTVDDLLGEVNGEDETISLQDGSDTLETGSSAVDVARGTIKADDIYVGMKGGFGDLRFGEIPLAIEYGQLANDIHDVSDDIGDGVSYTGTFGPASVIANYSSANGNDSDLIGAGVKFNFAGATIGLGFEDKDEGANVSAGVSYAIAGFSIAAQYWAKEDDFDPSVDIDTDAEDEVQTEGFDLDDQTSIAIKAGYTIYGVNAAITYSIFESQDVGDADTATGVFATSDAEQTVIRLDLGYDLGGGLGVSTRIDNVSDDGIDDDVINYRVQLAKSF